MYRLAFLALVASVSAYVIRDSQCPEFKNADNFNFENFSDGGWYEVARYHDDVVLNGKCGYLTYKTEGDVKKIKYNYVIDKTLMTIEGEAKLAPDAGTTGKLIHSLPYGANGTVVDCNLNILAVDYDSYFLAYYCQYDETSKTYRESAWVTSRSKILPEQSKAAIDKFVQESEFLDAGKFSWLPFSEEECKVVA